MHSPDEVKGLFPVGILGGGVPPDSLNPDPISDQKTPFSRPLSDLHGQKLCHHYLDWNTKEILNPFQIRISLFLSYSFGIEPISSYIHFSRKPYHIPDQNGKSLYLFSGRNSAKTVPFEATHIYLHNLYKGRLYNFQNSLISF